MLDLQQLDALWFQVTGLLCNLECTHCLVDSSPKNKSLDFLDMETIARGLDDASRLGVKEIYFTGGEPFLHKQMLEILELSLSRFPTTVLTNGTIITERIATQLGEIAKASPFSLELRVSIDHPNPETNDAVRGAGAHAKALRAVKRLEAVGLLPIITATEYLLSERKPGSQTIYEQYLALLKNAGVKRPRLKVIPVFHTGKLEDPSSGRFLTHADLEDMDPLLLQCASSRVITAEGVVTCPILVGKPEGKLHTQDLEASLGPVPLNHHACMTCFETGMSCSNF